MYIPIKLEYLLLQQIYFYETCKRIIDSSAFVLSICIVCNFCLLSGERIIEVQFQNFTLIMV